MYNDTDVEDEFEQHEVEDKIKERHKRQSKVGLDEVDLFGGLHSNSEVDLMQGYGKDYKFGESENEGSYGFGIPNYDLHTGEKSRKRSHNVFDKEKWY